jgi:exodeoxyribonuclease V alpha subunit
MEMLDGTLSRVMFHQPSKFDPAAAKYMIGRTAAGQTVKGSIENPVVGAQYRFWGEFKAQRNRDGEVAFEFDGYEPIVDASATGAETYLCDHVKGIGRAKAAALAEAFEGETLAILRETPERAKEVPGITDAIVDALRTHFDETRIDPAAYARLIDLFNRSGHKIPKKVVKQLLKDFRSDAPDKIKENPYLLLAYPGIGWATADSLAMTSLEYDPKGLGRHCAAMLEAIARVTNEGHTFATKPQIVAGVHSLIQQEPRWDAWHRLVTEGEIDGDGERYSTTRLWMSENVIASTLAKLATAALPLPCHLDNAGLAPDQAEALETIASSGVCLLVGPPGTGKSFTIARAIRGMRDGGVRSVKVMAPTGKAAKRAAELLRGAGIDTDDVPCTTIHRALGPVLSGSDPGVPGESAKSGRGRDGFEFIHGPGDPLDASVIVVDETSMVDVRLMQSLVVSIKPGTRVVFVGDENQLPSVGPGSTLRDMLGSGLPVARLRDIKRSDGGGRVVRACHAIKDGRTPEPAGQLALPTENWIHIEASDPATIAREVVNLYGLFKSVDPVWDVQTISAQKGRHAFGCDALNSLLADKLNPPPPGEPIDPNGQAPPFRVGDKVVRLKNGNADELRPIAKRDSWGDEWRWDGQAWDTSQTVCIVNGDLGEVLSMSPDDKGKTYVVVRFRDPDRLVRLPFAEHHLARAYALTVHKGQGSGWPVVIVPVHTAFYWDARTGTGLWCRELIYTAISRAEKALITVGQWAAVRTAIGRQTVHQRRTRLAPLLADAMAGRPVGFGLPALPGPPEPTAKVETANPYDFSEMMTDA